jgi:hypothetical protein
MGWPSRPSDLSAQGASHFSHAAGREKTIPDLVRLCDGGHDQRRW